MKRRAELCRDARVSLEVYACNGERVTLDSRALIIQLILDANDKATELMKACAPFHQDQQTFIQLYNAIGNENCELRTQLVQMFLATVHKTKLVVDGETLNEKVNLINCTYWDIQPRLADMTKPAGPSMAKL